MREAKFSDAAAIVFDALSATDQAVIWTLVRLLERNPEIDDLVKFDLHRSPLVLRLLDDGEWQIVYFILDAATVKIHAIARTPRNR